MNTLTLPLIRFARHDGTTGTATLPGILAASMHDEVAAFTALRPHQRHAWHAFLAQLATLSLVRAGLDTEPDDEDAWCGLLRGLTPDYADDAPWCLVASPDRPALLQAALPGGDVSELRNVVHTPDSLDMLVTSKTHDLKGGVMAQAAPDDWLFALVTLQTMEGFLGAGNYGISRMNGGFSNRPALSLAPLGGPGAHLRRDVRRLLAMNGRPPLSAGHAERDGLALVWLHPWDGAASLARSVLDPLYVEVCRRVRLHKAGAGFAARVGGSKAARIAAPPGGVTGDPWTPVRPDKDGLKALTVDARGFSYRPLVDLLFARDGAPAPLQAVADDDATDGLALVARALVRGQGKTEGYHERRVLLSRTVRRRAVPTPTDPVAHAAHERVQLAGDMAGILRFALLALFENGPAKVDPGNDAAGRKAKPFMARFEREVDLTFFDALWQEAEKDDGDEREAERGRWVRALLRIAETLLIEADHAAAKASRRRFRARVSADAALQGGVRRHPRLSGYFAIERTPNVV
jgi:CRISPR system Cascade subunit CasA